MRHFPILLLFILPLPILALETDYRLTVRSGVIMDDGKVEKVSPNRMPLMGADFSVAFHPEWQALREWNNAGIGVGLTYWYLGDNRMLGHAIAPYTFLDIPLVRCPHFVLGLRPGVGVVFATKTYRNTVPEGHMFQDTKDANQCIGSVFNLYLPEQIYMDFPIRNGWAITLGGGWQHISNGSTVQPNSGYNMFSAELGVRYTPAKDYPGKDIYGQVDDSRKKKWELELGWTGGGRQVYYRDRQTFFCSTISLSAYWRAHNIFRLGGGVDVFYDGAYRGHHTEFKKTAQEFLGEPADCWRVGISVQPDFVIGRFTAGFRVGVYLYDEVKNLEAEFGSKDYKILWENKERLHKPIFYKYDLTKAGTAGNPDGWLYTMVVMRYRLPWHLFIEGQMKAHLTKVEFVSAGLGVWL